MAIEDVQTNLRIPSSLKEQLQASADAAGRSLSSEAAHRLALSYDLEQLTAELRGALAALQQQHLTTLNRVDGAESELRSRERYIAKLEERLAVAMEARKERDDAALSVALIEQSVAAAIAAVDSYDMRIQIAHSRLDSLDVRRRLILSESSSLNHEAKTDEDFRKLAAAMAQLNAIETDAKQVSQDMDVLQRDRAATFKHIERMTRDLRKARKEAEAMMDAARSGSDKGTQEGPTAPVSERSADSQLVQVADSASTHRVPTPATAPQRRIRIPQKKK